MIHSFKELLPKVYDGQSLTVYIAHVFEYGYWKSSTKHCYNIYEVTDKYINMVNADHPTEHLRLDDKMMDGYIKVEL